MDLGVFIPIGSNGWLISTTSPQYQPSFALNRDVVQRAERYGFEFALSMVKLRGFGGKSEFWDHCLESFTLMAALAAVTSRIKLFASAAVLTLPPAIAARMAATIDSVAPGRFGVNIVSGWQEAEYSQMGLWPGKAHFDRRYQYCAEYVTVMRELWADGKSDLQGEFFQMTDCRLSPRPSVMPAIVAAGQSGTGMQFAAEYADYNFCMGTPRPPSPPPLAAWSRQAERRGARSARTPCSWSSPTIPTKRRRPSGSCTRTARTWTR
jgi:pyrimidine oxygenase